MSDAKQDEAAPPAGKKRGKLPMIAGGAAVLLLACGGVYVWRSKTSRAAGSAPVATAIIDLPTVVANLDGGEGHTRYAKLTARLEIADSRDRRVIDDDMPRIQDAMQTYLHETRPEELGGAGIYRLREAMLSEIRNTVAPVEVRDIYFTELLSQ